MEILHKKSFNSQRFVSLGLFLTLTILVITAIVIQIFEALEIDFFIHLFTVIHIFSGLTFTILSVFHSITNWQAMRGYIKSKNLVISREAIYAFLLMTVAILAGILFVCFVMD